MCAVCRCPAELTAFHIVTILTGEGHSVPVAGAHVVVVFPASGRWLYLVLAPPLVVVQDECAKAQGDVHPIAGAWRETSFSSSTRTTQAR